MRAYGRRARASGSAFGLRTPALHSAIWDPSHARVAASAHRLAGVTLAGEQAPGEAVISTFVHCIGCGAAAAASVGSVGLSLKAWGWAAGPTFCNAGVMLGCWAP